MSIHPGPAATCTSRLRGAGIDTVIITGGETDVCVLSTMLGAIDWGFRVILIQNAFCSSADETHDAMMNIYMSRFGEQVETVTTETLLESWAAYIAYYTLVPQAAGGRQYSDTMGRLTFIMLFHCCPAIS
jgi:Isochorismatase family